MHKIDYINDRSAWAPQDMLIDESWKYVLSRNDVSEINNALMMCKSKISSLNEITQYNFPLENFKNKLHFISNYLEYDRGVFVIKGLPVEKYIKEELKIIFIGLGCYIGHPLRQSTEGEIIQDVYDKGENLYSKSGRGTNSSNKLPWHTDRCDVVSLLCVNKSYRGGESKLASLTNVYNQIKKQRPELADVLCTPFYHGRAPFEMTDARPWYEMPIFTEYDEKFASRYLRRFIEIAQEYEDVPRFTHLQIEALDYLDNQFNQPNVCLDLSFDVGDIQLINNFVICHSRNEYTDSNDQSRFLYRLWLSAYNSRSLDPLFEPLYGNVKGGEMRGGILFS